MEAYIGQLDRGPAQDEPAFTSFLRAIKRHQKTLRTYLVVGQPHHRLTNGTPCKGTQTTGEFVAGRTEVLQRFRAGARDSASRYKNRRIASGCSQKDSIQKIKPIAK